MILGGNNGYKIIFKLELDDEEIAHMSKTEQIIPHDSNNLKILVGSCFDINTERIHYMILVPLLTSAKTIYDGICKENPLLSLSDNMIIFISENMENMHVEYTVNGKQYRW